MICASLYCTLGEVDEVFNLFWTLKFQTARKLKIIGSLRNVDKRNDNSSCEKYYFSFSFSKILSASLYCTLGEVDEVYSNYRT